VPVGEPVLNVSMDDMDKSIDELAYLRRTLAAWIQVDQVNRAYATLDIPVFVQPTTWAANVPPDAPRAEAVYANPNGGMSIDQLHSSVRPVLRALRYNYERKGIVEGRELADPLLGFVGANRVG